MGKEVGDSWTNTLPDGREVRYTKMVNGSIAFQVIQDTKNLVRGGLSRVEQDKKVAVEALVLFDKLIRNTTG